MMSWWHHCEMTFLQYKKLVLSYWGEDGARMLYIDPLMLFIATCNQQESRKLKAQPLKFDVIKASHFYVSFNYSCLRWPNFFFNSCTIIIFTQTELALCDSALKKRSDSFYVTIILWIYRPCCNCVITYQRWLMSMRWEVKLVRVKNRTGARREGQVSCERKQGGWLIQPSEKKTWAMGLWLNWKDKTLWPSSHLTPWLQVCHVPVRLTASSNVFVWYHHSIWSSAFPMGPKRTHKNLSYYSDWTEVVTFQNRVGIYLILGFCSLRSFDFWMIQHCYAYFWRLHSPLRKMGIRMLFPAACRPGFPE